MATAKTPAEHTEPTPTEPVAGDPIAQKDASGGLTNVAITAEDKRGINRITGYVDTTWEPAPVSPSAEEKAHAAALVEAGVVPAPEKGADAPHVDVPESAKLPKQA